MTAAAPGTYAQNNLNIATPRRRAPLRAAEPEVFGALQARLDELLPHDRAVRVLNAGCGSGRRYVPLSDNPTVVGIDVEADEPAVERFTERLVGDVQTYDFGPRRFDAVYCWNVLEHVPQPHQALLNLVSTLDPGGVVILGLPHAASVKGLITRFTPHWVHEWLWRHVLHADAAAAAAVAAAGEEPFPTVLSRAVTPRAIKAFAQEQGLRVEFYREYEAWPQKKIRTKLHVTGRVFAAIAWVVRRASFGRVTAGATDVVFVLRKS
jgi:SAM-dependent methyltransferase